MNTQHPDTDRHSMDLTQLSSREQLSALMDGALPADQTRFLLRRLQHDDSLAGSWERWRIAGEAMRGLAPAQRLPADFAQRVSSALHGEAEAAGPATAVTATRMPAWVRWGGGAAMAASLAVVALIASRPGGLPAEGVAPAQVAAVATDVPSAPVAAELPPAAPATVAEAPVALAAAAVQPVRTRKAERAAAPARQASAPRLVAGADTAEQVAAPVPAPQPPIATRPWPRSVLPQYATGGLAVGFGEGAAATPHNPFRQPRLVMVPVQAPVADPDGPAADARATDAPAAADAPVPAEP